MIQNLKDIIRIFWAYGLEFKDSNGFTHYWFTLIPDLGLEYKTSIHSSIGKTPKMLAKGGIPRLPYDYLKEDLVDINLMENSFKTMLDNERNHANRFIKYSFKYSKEKWAKSYKPPYFKAGDSVLVSALNFNNIKVPKKMKYSSSGTFMIKEAHFPNAVQLELTGELMNQHPDFPVSLIKPYSSSYKQLFPLRKKRPLEISPLEGGEEKKILKVLKDRSTRKKRMGILFKL
ncbi:hypothetical protein O181_036470 [Austropuccinia psidii MF-1]|uniref:Uncharacterized protein n=1 Tax=Austropuccinia psidii MF-1 TaxID=1389203 RepID=A0A9Q3D6L4_9BASI|nr:hypothetical protein [Austropuccinia psidii MF-1]